MSDITYARPGAVYDDLHGPYRRDHARNKCHACAICGTVIGKSRCRMSPSINIDSYAL